VAERVRFLLERALTRTVPIERGDLGTVRERKGIAVVVDFDRPELPRGLVLRAYEVATVEEADRG